MSGAAMTKPYSRRDFLGVALERIPVMLTHSLHAGKN